MHERENAIIILKEKQDSLERILSAFVNATGASYTNKLSNSPKQLQELFYSRMGLRPIERVLDGEVKRPMNRETLEKLSLSDQFAEPIINAILLDRDLKKSLQVLETQIDPDWRWRCSYNIGGTTTGRFSSSKSPFMAFVEESQAWKQTGNNFQNITEELRRVFIPDTGFKLYGIDKAQSEARDVGWFCGIMFGDWSYLNACESGDLHTAVTRLLYPDWDWTGDLKKDRQIAERRFYRLFTFRDASKRLGHATNYYGSPKEISRQTRIPLNLVEEFQVRYFTAFPCIRRMHEWVAQQLQRERFLVNSFGRKRDFFDRPNDPDTLKGGIAYLFQSATGDCLNLGLYRLWKKMGTGPVQILSQLHDAVYFQMPETSEAEEQDWLKQAIDCIQVTQKFVNRTMTIPGEAVAGYNWAHRFRLLEDGSREDWNPKGLQGIRIN
jgi:DNA polymerase I-like protein with 3'-5' exonuclease and polymerase domains